MRFTDNGLPVWRDSEHAVEKLHSLSGPIVESLRPAEAVRLFIFGYGVGGIDLRYERVFAGHPFLLSEHPGGLEARIFRRLYEPYWDSDSVNGRYQPVANVRVPAPCERGR